jgi:hypothetical protein
MSNYEQIYRVTKVKEIHTTLDNGTNCTDLEIEYEDWNRIPMSKTISLYPKDGEKDATIDSVRAIVLKDESGTQEIMSDSLIKRLQENK